jgi:catechol 2,3-dioxygenase-like lactoylglutathione lyase family enzyme
VLTGIDHIVILVDDLETAISDYAALGFTVVRGGRHPIGTHNALVGFSDGSYLELLAFYEPRPEQRWWPALQRGGGLVDFCMATDDLRTDMEALRRAGVAMSDLFPLSRQRPDGYTVRWVLSVPGDDFARAMPFLIQDETPLDERIPAERRHANRVTGVASLTCVTPDTASAQRRFAGVFRQAARPIVRDDLDAAGVRFTVGRHAIDYLTPRGPAGSLSDWLRVEGPSPYAVTLNADVHANSLDPAKLRRARLALA